MTLSKFTVLNKILTEGRENDNARVVNAQGQKK